MTMFSDDGEQGTGASRVGAELRAARQRLGWDLPGVAASLRIRQSYLEAIEDGRIADLPGNAYAMGFLRTYADAMGLDATEVARRFRAESQEVNRKTELSFPAPVPERGVPAMAVVLLGLVMAGGAYVAWWQFSERGSARVETVQPVPERLAPLAESAAPPSTPSPQVASILPPSAPGSAPAAAPATPAAPAAPSSTLPATGQPAAQPAQTANGSALPTPPTPPVAAPPVVPAPPPQPEARIVLHVKADTFIQVRERQGQVLLSRVLRNGESWPVPEKAQLLMTTGNAGATELVVDGKPGPNLGQLGAIRRDVPLDPDTLKLGRISSSSH